MRSQGRLPKVLMYHSVSEQGYHDALCVSPERFKAQMLYLDRRKLRGVSMRELRLTMNGGDTGSLVGLTFDDGYEDFLSAALPILESLGFSATVFVVAGKLGQENDWEHGDGATPKMRLLDADGVRELSNRGIEVGSHTMTHPRLSGLDPDTLASQVGESRRVLSEVVGTPVEGFCYPYGDLDGAAVRAVRGSGYAYACATKTRVERSIYDWPRAFVGDRDSSRRLGIKLKLQGFLPGRR